MADAKFEEARLAGLYDAMHPDRSDLDVYAAMAVEFGARSVLDVGCGTGTLACMLARRGCTVTGIDPAEASLAVARRKPGADHVRWLRGPAASVPPLRVDLALMTGNVAQVFVTSEEWAATLRAVRDALRPGGRLVFESRDPSRKAWLEWTRERTRWQADVPGTGPVDTWTDLTSADDGLVSFRASFAFGRDGATMTSDSTLRFRGREELAATVAAAGLAVDEVRDAPDRPGHEFVFVTRRPDPASQD